MKKLLKVLLTILVIIVSSFILDFICIYTLKRPLFGVQARQPYTYSGIFYNTYNCPEYSVPKIKLKSTKFACAIDIADIGKLVDIIDTTKDKKDFACAEALEEFYRDEKYIYFHNCLKGKYVIVRYESGYEETVEQALKNKTITISDLDKHNIDYIKQEIELIGE